MKQFYEGNNRKRTIFSDKRSDDCHPSRGIYHQYRLLLRLNGQAGCHPDRNQCWDAQIIDQKVHITVTVGEPFLQPVSML